MMVKNVLRPAEWKPVPVAEGCCPHGRHSDEDCPDCFRAFIEQTRGLRLVSVRAVDEVLGGRNGQQ